MDATHGAEEHMDVARLDVPDDVAVNAWDAV
jgi:hypothetical protein